MRIVFVLCCALRASHFPARRPNKLYENYLYSCLLLTDSVTLSSSAKTKNVFVYRRLKVPCFPQSVQNHQLVGAELAWQSCALPLCCALSSNQLPAVLLRLRSVSFSCLLPPPCARCRSLPLRFFLPQTSAFQPSTQRLHGCCPR